MYEISTVMLMKAVGVRSCLIRTFYKLLCFMPNVTVQLLKFRLVPQRQDILGSDMIKMEKAFVLCLWMKSLWLC